MSVKKATIRYAAFAIVVSLGLVAASFLYIGIPGNPATSVTSSGSQSGQLAPLAIRLTDPPQVPSLTSALNLTYSAIELLVGEPIGTLGQLDTSSVNVIPAGGSGTIDLLTLQNVSQTIAVAKLPIGSVLYSVTFTVARISIDVNGTASTVSLATGGNSFEVTMVNPSAFSSGDFALLQLNPVVVDTPSGYQLVPSSVGIMGHGEGNDEVGDQQQLNNSDNAGLGTARGNVSAIIKALSVSGNVTTLVVLVNNSASVSVDLVGIGLHGNFTVIGNACSEFGFQGRGGNGSSHSHDASSDSCPIPMHMDEVIFVPTSPETTAASATISTSGSPCATDQMTMSSGQGDKSDEPGFGFQNLTLNPGQCVALTFVGKLAFGESNSTLVPSTAAGQVYVIHVIASQGVNQLVSCTLPLGAASCTVLNGHHGHQD